VHGAVKTECVYRTDRHIVLVGRHAWCLRTNVSGRIPEFGIYPMRNVKAVAGGTGNN